MPKKSRLEKETRIAPRSTADGHETVALKRERKSGNPAFSIGIFRCIASYAAEGDYTASGSQSPFPGSPVALRRNHPAGDRRPGWRTPGAASETRAKLAVQHADPLLSQRNGMPPKSWTSLSLSEGGGVFSKNIYVFLRFRHTPVRLVQTFGPILHAVCRAVSDAQAVARMGLPSREMLLYLLSVELHADLDEYHQMLGIKRLMSRIELPRRPAQTKSAGVFARPAQKMADKAGETAVRRPQRPEHE